MRQYSFRTISSEHPLKTHLVMALLMACPTTLWAGESVQSGRPEAKPAADAAGSTLSDAAWQTLRRQAVERPRRIIFNNDGNEPVYFCKAATAEELLKARTSRLAGSQVDSIFYCTWSSGFGLFTHNTKAGQVFSTREAMFKDNRTQEFLDRKLDPLQVMADFAHQHGMELFWSMRMNDTHDGAGADYGPVMFRANRLKQEHPEWLIGSKEHPPRHGAWSAVDYGVPEIRDLAFRYCAEVCRNYQVNGIELDFFRHAFFFRCSGRGEPCGDAELDQMTALVRRIRAATEEAGRKCNRPILLAVRVPDSTDYCRLIGIDLERWLREGLVDLLIVSGYTQLNPWEYSVQLGHRYGVKVYPSLDEPRVRDEGARKLRGTPAAYRGRALNVWHAGADGVYLFNFFDPASSLWRELGDPAGLRKLERTYFASVRGVGSMPVPHQKFLRVPTLNPASPVSVAAGKPGRVVFRVGEDFAGAGEPARICLRLRFKNMPAAGQFHGSLNQQPLSNGEIRDVWMEYQLNAKALCAGINLLEVSCADSPAGPFSLLDLCIEVTPAED
ncbi:MAG TPA: hypothetical protein P5205_10865 [Candidatus Paceibacterota bacterium]|nr:hypothetical protein [Verrucomicrobiota bacterium]HSA10857.1 hypothetical protein [Candidatus Paceibacterota bacterium]